MNIINISPLLTCKNNTFVSKTNEKFNVPTKQFGLVMAAPLSCDTVNFKGAVNTNKTLGDLADAVTRLLAKQIRDIYKKPHEDMLKLINNNYGDLFEKGLIELKKRIKKEFSIQEKTTSIGVLSKNEILKNMQDISGFAFLLDDGRAFQQFLTRTAKLVKSKEFSVVDMEYYRIPPKLKRGKVVESYDSLNANGIQKLGNIVDEVNQSEKPILNEKPSPAGYSGLHITIKDKNGLYHEWQIMTRAMWNLKEIENLYYKMKEGKAIDPKYSYIEDVLSGLKPLSEYATEKEKNLYKVFKNKIKQYTLEAYKERLKRPFENRMEFLKPSDPEIAKYDFNKIAKLKEACDGMTE